MPYQIEIPGTEEFRSSDNRELGDVLPEEKALPFVKWAGGKRSIIDKINKFLPANIETYHEPFVGGGAVFFAFQHRIQKATLADLNQVLVLAYLTIRNDPEPLIESLENHARKHQKVDGYYMKVRNSKPRTDINKVSRFLYLNKTCFNGLYRVNKRGEFNVPEGKYSNPKICDAENLRNASKVLQKAEIQVGQFHKTILPEAGDFVYCDPPYDGTFSEYHSDGFTATDQKRLKDSVDAWTKQGVSVMISNSDTEFIKELYNRYHIHAITAQRNISCDGKKRGQIPEVLITNYGFK